jgi:hypothetical protein
MADDPALARARLRGKRAALGVVIAFSVGIIGLSAVQIVPAVFGAGITPIPAAQPGTKERTCADGVRRLASALDRAADSAGNASFEQRLQPEWGDAGWIHEACKEARQGLDAWAALARLRSAEEQLGPRAPLDGQLEPLRRDVQAHLPADLR